MRLLHEGFSRLYQTPLSGREILLASLRRLTEYKTNLIKRFLDQHEQLEGIAQELNRPIFWLFGGIGHKDDIGANKQLSKLLGKIEEINSKQGLFRADFLLNYDLRKARWLFPGLALRGCWVGCTNPLDKRSQGTEAFGPSAIKSVMNGACLIGPDDGGATSLNYLPTVRVFGPRTRSGAISNHNDLWANEEIRRQSKLLMVNGFVGAFSDAARKIHADLIRFENNQGELAPGLHDKIIAVLTTIAHWNGRVLMDAYLGKTRK
jgi:glucan phosphorylase